MLTFLQNFSVLLAQNKVLIWQQFNCFGFSFFSFFSYIFFLISETFLQNVCVCKNGFFTGDRPRTQSVRPDARFRYVRRAAQKL